MKFKIKLKEIYDLVLEVKLKCLVDYELE